MAQSLPCDMCQQEEALMIQTNLKDGSVITVGASCLHPFYVEAARMIEQASTTHRPSDGPQSDAETPPAGDAAQPPQDAPGPPVAPQDAYTADRKAMLEAAPGSFAPSGAHLHTCPVHGPFAHCHKGSTRPHEHDCTHGHMTYPEFAEKAFADVTVPAADGG